jgi:hypothetical protein
MSSLLAPARRAGRSERSTLDDPLVVGQQGGGQAGAEAAGAFDGPHPAVVAFTEGDEPSIPLGIGGHGELVEDGARRTDGRRSVGVLVSIDADDDVEGFCQHDVAPCPEE